VHSEAGQSIAKSDPPQPYAQVTATQQIGILGKAVRDAFQDAMAMRGRLSDDAFRVNGFSGRKFRLLLNNLMRAVPNPRYLEIGAFHGASFCSALFKNKMRAVAIDNWLWGKDTKKLFTDNLNRFVSEDSDVQVIEGDFRKVEYDKLAKFNILFYDGAHDEKDQYDGVFIPQRAMEYPHVMIVDDWNWDRVRKGTLDALRDAKLGIDYSVEVRTTFNNDYLPLVNGPGSEWHNGTIVAVVSKLA
jgi:hypothetical protein